MTEPNPIFFDMPGHLIRRLNQIATALFREHMAEIGLDVTPVQFAVLAALSDAPDIDQATLATTVAYDKVTIGGVIDRLVAKGLVDRRASPKDRRAKALRLTQNGVVMLDRLRPQIRILQEEILTGLSRDEGDTLVALLKKATLARNAAQESPR